MNTLRTYGRIRRRVTLEWYQDKDKGGATADVDQAGRRGYEAGVIFSRVAHLIPFGPGHCKLAINLQGPVDPFTDMLRLEADDRLISRERLAMGIAECAFIRSVDREIEGRCRQIIRINPGFTTDSGHSYVE